MLRHQGGGGNGVIWEGGISAGPLKDEEDVGQQPFHAEEPLGVKGLASAHLFESVISWYPGA